MLQSEEEDTHGLAHAQRHVIAFVPDNGDASDRRVVLEVGEGVPTHASAVERMRREGSTHSLAVRKARNGTGRLSHVVHSWRDGNTNPCGEMRYHPHMGILPSRDRALSILARMGGRLPSWGAMILGGRSVPVPGAVVINWTNSACAPETTDRTPRRVPPRNITLHTNTGEPRDPPTTEAEAASTRECQLARYQTTTDRDVSWDFLVSTLGFAAQQNDPLRYYTWQAGNVNGYSLGIETEQGPGGVLHKPSIDALVHLVDALTRELGIQRQVPAVMVGGRRVPDRRVLARFGPGQDGASWWGVMGHRNITSNRGPGDPGDAIIQALLDAGYEGFDLASGEDLAAWRLRQLALGVPSTGKPGPDTVAALARLGFKHGMYVRRPGD